MDFFSETRKSHLSVLSNLINCGDLRLDFLTVATVKNVIVWDVTPNTLVRNIWEFRRNMLPPSSGSKSKSKKQVIDVCWSGLFVYPEYIGGILFPKRRHDDGLGDLGSIPGNVRFSFLHSVQTASCPVGCRVSFLGVKAAVV
jgi:hypothetical protein